MPNVRRIGYGAVIGAGSVVTKDILPMTVVGGNPAKKILTIEEYKNKLEASMNSSPIIEFLLGGYLLTYIKTYMTK